MSPISSKTPEDKQLGMPSKASHWNIIQPFPRTFLLPKSQSPRGHSFSREIRCPEDAPFRKHCHPETSFFVPSKVTAATNSIDICLHLWSLLRRRSSHVSNIAMTRTQTRTATKCSKNRSHYQGQNPSYYKRITTWRSCSY